MLCANADELPTHLYCFTLQLVIQSTRNQHSTPNQTRPKAEHAARGSSLSHTAPQLCQADVQLYTNTFTKKNYQGTSNTAQEAHRASLTPTTNLVPDTAVPPSLRWERMETAPTPMNSSKWNSPLKKRSVGKRVNLHVTQERRCCHRAVHGSVGGDPTLKDFHVVREHPAFLSPLIPIPLSGIWLKPHVFVLW